MVTASRSVHAPRAARGRPSQQRHKQLEAELVQFVRTQSAGIQPGERLVGSTEVLESVFGKWKTLERQESNSGITSFLLSLGAMLGTWTASRLQEALTQTPVKQVKSWCRTHLPPSVQSQRRLAFDLPSLKTNPARSPNDVNPDFASPYGGTIARIVSLSANPARPSPPTSRSLPVPPIKVSLPLPPASMTEPVNDLASIKLSLSPPVSSTRSTVPSRSVPRPTFVSRNVAVGTTVSSTFVSAKSMTTSVPAPHDPSRLTRPWIT